LVVAPLASVNAEEKTAVYFVIDPIRLSSSAARQPNSPPARRKSRSGKSGRSGTRRTLAQVMSAGIRQHRCRRDVAD